MLVPQEINNYFILEKSKALKLFSNIFSDVLSAILANVGNINEGVAYILFLHLISYLRRQFFFIYLRNKDRRQRKTLSTRTDAYTSNKHACANLCVKYFVCLLQVHKVYRYNELLQVDDH